MTVVLVAVVLVVVVVVVETGHEHDDGIVDSTHTGHEHDDDNVDGIFGTASCFADVNYA